MTKERKVLLLSGPTAVGKTALSIALAKALDTEIISADALQIYRGLDIGTAKVTPEERKGVPHHLIDIVDPNERFTVSDYRERALALIDHLNDQGKIPLVVGGTGLYLNAILYDMSFGRADVDAAFRADMEKRAKQEGKMALYALLVSRDPEAADRIHPHNTRRVIRALEIHHLGGRKKNFTTDPVPTKNLRPLLIGLTRDRQVLYDRIDRRVLQMIEEGLIEEVKSLKNSGIDDNSPALKGIGYKEVITTLEGGLDFDALVATLQRNSRRYAKRQLTWLKRYSDLYWLDLDKTDSVAQAVEQIQSLIATHLL